MSLAANHYFQEAPKESVCAVCITHILTTTLTVTPSRNSGVTRAYNNSSNGNRRGPVGGSNMVRVNTVVTTNGTSSHRRIAPAPAALVTAPSTLDAASPAPVTAPPTPVFQAVLMPHNAIESSTSCIGYSYRVSRGTLDSLKSTMTSGCGESSHFDPPATITVAVYSTLRAVSIVTFIICVTDIQGFLHDTLLPALNMPGLGRHLFSGETVALEGMNMAFAKNCT